MENDRIFTSCDPYFTMNEATQQLEPHLDYKDYLYYSSGSTSPFIIYELELKRLNDYLVFLLKHSTEQKEEDLNLVKKIEPDYIFIEDNENNVVIQHQSNTFLYWNNTITIIYRKSSIRFNTLDSSHYKYT